jgi:hypothetical protein
MEMCLLLLLLLLLLLHSTLGHHKQTHTSC